MVKKLDELNKQFTDPNSPESQEFLRLLHERNVKKIAEAKLMIEKWREEDRRNEIK